MSRDLDAEESSDALDQPARDEGERAEAEWLLARDGNPGATPPSAEVALEYSELEHMLATLPDPASDHSWHDAVLKKAMASPAEGAQGEVVQASPAARRAWWKEAPARWASGGIAAAAAAAAIIVMSLRGPQPYQFAVNEVYKEGFRGETRTLSILETRGPKGELRVFRKKTLTSQGVLIASCVHSEPRCKETDRGLELDISIEEPGYYFVVSTDKAVTVPDDATLEEFQQAARSQRVNVQSRPPSVRK